MQQRRPRLGDIVDDYCPRERRLTNHAIVAMIEDDIKQTRCTTCDAEHEYKQGRMPTLRRKKEAVSAAYQEVLAAVKAEAPVAAVAVPAAEGPDEAAGDSGAEPVVMAAPPSVPVQADAAPHDEPEEAAEGADPDVAAAGRVHRRLIRATLPRPENQQAVRPVPEFTMRQPTGRPGKFRGGPARGMGGRPGAGRGGNVNGNSRGPAFGRGAVGRGGGQGGRPVGRPDGHRHPRGAQQARPGKKHSK